MFASLFHSQASQKLLLADMLFLFFITFSFFFFFVGKTALLRQAGQERRNTANNIVWGRKSKFSLL